MTARSTSLALPQIRAARATLRIAGTSPLLICNWQTRLGRHRLDREAQIESARYLEDGRDALPIAALREAFRVAASMLDAPGPSGAVVFGAACRTGLLPLRFTKRSVVETTRLHRGNPVPFIRLSYDDWDVSLPIQILERGWSIEQILRVLGHAGSKVGVGQDRPQHGGTHGRFDWHAE